MTILYHYCSNSAFHSIVENKSIWLSSLSLSNDSMEGKLVTEVLYELSKKDGLNKTSIKRLQDSAKSLEDIIDGLGFCLSEEGDLLSQWRGYASDATGVSIGFSKNYLETISETSKDLYGTGFSLSKVEYEKNKQKKLIEPTYLKIKDLIKQGAFNNVGLHGLLDLRTQEEIDKESAEVKKISKSLSLTVLTLFAKLFQLKTKAFREEQEWRLISYFVKSGTDPCLFRAKKNRIIPYRKFELPVLKEDSISEVIIGPKNITPDYVIKSFLNQHGFKGVKVLRSEAAYR